MKASIGLCAGLFLLVFIVHPLHSQRLSKTLQDKIETISESFPSIGKERLAKLDQTAWLITQDYARDDRSEVLILDADNASLSQLGQVWLQASGYYFGLKGLSVASAGISPESFDKALLPLLAESGFKIKGQVEGNEEKTRIDYGSGSWALSSKGYQEIDNQDEHFVILLFDSTSQAALEESGDSDKRLPLSFEEITSRSDVKKANETIALHMAYLTYRIKLNLLELKKI